MEKNYAVPLAAEPEGLQVAVAAEVQNDGNGNDDGGGEHERVANGGAEGGVMVKRKRGRPRKHQLGDVITAAAPENSGGPQKRGRGRPRGSGKWQTLANSLGLSAGEVSGSNFTPYVIDIQAGQNIVEKILAFSQMTTDSICILSASGTVSTAELFVPVSRGGILRFEGHFSIVCLNGSHTYGDHKRGDKTRLLSVKLANISDGRFFGGAVGPSLIAAGPTQIIISTFKQKFKQQPSIRPASIGAPSPNENGAVSAPLLPPENGRVSEAQRVDDGFIVGHPSSAQPADWDSLQPSSNM